MGYNLTCIVTGHREGKLAEASLESYWAAISKAQRQGFNVQPLLILDAPDEATLDIFKRYQKTASPIQVKAFRDQGKLRNEAIVQAEGRYTAFLDADDLWSSDWLVQALEFLSGAPENHIAHPQYNYFFDQQQSIFRHIDQLSPEFDSDLLRIRNYWDALCVCPTSIHRELPYCHRDVENGWAFEDWHWNCETVAAGKIHRVVPGSVIFKRRRAKSQTVEAAKSFSWIRPHSLSRYPLASDM